MLILAYLLAILGSTLISAEIEFPIQWHSKAYFNRMIPATHDYFIDGYIGIKIDLVRHPGSGLVFYGGAAKWTMMGREAANIIFDPRFAHYSLEPGIKWEREEVILYLRWIHDCYHEIDINTMPTVIWNSYELGIMNRGFSPEERRAELSGKGELEFDPRLDWNVVIGAVPQDRHSVWLQRNHDITAKLASELRFSAVSMGPIHVELEYRPLIYLHMNNDLTHRQYFHIALVYYTEMGIMSGFWGYYARDTQPIRPKDDTVRLGFRWEY